MIEVLSGIAIAGLLATVWLILRDRMHERELHDNERQLWYTERSELLTRIQHPNRILTPQIDTDGQQSFEIPEDVTEYAAVGEVDPPGIIREENE